MFSVWYLVFRNAKLLSNALYTKNYTLNTILNY